MVKNPPANAGDLRGAGSIPGSGRSPGGFLPGESHGQRRLASHSSQGYKESDVTKGTEHECRRPYRVPLRKLQRL